MSCFQLNQVNILDQACISPMVDVKKITRIGRKCFPNTDSSYYRSYLQEPSHRFVCLFDNQKRYIAFCFLHFLPKQEIYIHTVCTNDLFKRQQCCARLMLYLIQNYSSDYNMSLHVRIGKTTMYQGKEPNIAACKCYSKFGFLASSEHMRIDPVEGLMMKMIRSKNPVKTKDLQVFQDCSFVQVVEDGTSTRRSKTSTKKNIFKNTLLTSSKPENTPTHEDSYNVKGKDKIVLGKIENKTVFWKRVDKDEWAWSME